MKIRIGNKIRYIDPEDYPDIELWCKIFNLDLEICDMQ